MSTIQIAVGAPSTTSNADGIAATMLGGKSAEGIVAELHGKWYTAAYRGRVFCAPTLIAGVTIPVNTTTAATYIIWNPVGSGVNLEMISLNVASLAAGTVGSLLASVATQTPTSPTLLTPISVPVGAGGTAQGKVATAATITAVTTHIPLQQVQTTTGGSAMPNYRFDGELVVAPGGMINLVSNPVQTAVAIPCWFWAEWPV